MRVIGLTGSIGMGKSTLANQLRSQGIPVHDADACVHDLLSPNGAAFQPVKNAFPSVVKNGKIDRKKLGGIIFNDAEKRSILESILHPMVRKSSAQFVQQCRRRRVPICVLDIPLLFELGRDKDVDAVLCVTAPSWVQRRRVLSRAGMTEAKFESIKALQMPDLRKRHLSDYIVQTGRGRRHSLQLIKRFKRVV